MESGPRSSDVEIDPRVKEAEKKWNDLVIFIGNHPDKFEEFNDDVANFKDNFENNYPDSSVYTKYHLYHVIIGSTRDSLEVDMGDFPSSILSFVDFINKMDADYRRNG
jgi:hypothetical protein